MRAHVCFLDDDSFFDEYKVFCLQTYASLSSSQGCVLDFGCGIWKLTGAVARAPPQIELGAKDVPSESVALAAEEHKLLSNINFLNELPVSRKYEVIIVSNLLHHIESSMRADTLRALGDLLVAGGRIVVFERNPFNPLTRLVASRCAFDEGVELLGRRGLLRLAESVDLIADYSHYCLFSPWRFAWLKRIENAFKHLPIGAQHMTSLSNPREAS